MMSIDKSSLTPSLKSFLAALKSRPVDASAEQLAVLLRRRQIWGARRCAVATANLLINVVASYRSSGNQDLLTRVRDVAQNLVRSQPCELSIGNVVRRVEGLIRDANEAHKASIADGVASAIGNDTQQAHCSVTVSRDESESTVKEDVLDGIRELLDELDQAERQISEYSNEHIFPEETILILGGSRTVQRFLLDAGKRRKFHVFHVEGYPNEDTLAHDIATSGAVRDSEEAPSAQNRLKALTAAGTSVTVIPDSQVFAVMPSVSKVLLSAQGTFANGGCLLSCGAKSIASSANFHGKPVLVLAAIYRLGPTFPYQTKAFVELGDPGVNVPFDSGMLLDSIQSPRYLRDYLPPDLVSVFITNIGGSVPTQMQRLASDHYRRQDIEL